MWIDVSTIPELQNKERLLLFGAGQGTIDFLDYLDSLELQMEFIGIADNDKTMHGKILRGIPIIDPGAIPSIQCSKIIVTTISGKEDVSIQLNKYGFAENSDFFCIGKYPEASFSNIKILMRLDKQFPILTPRPKILHVGPGGFLGMECCLYALGCKTVSIDAYSFGMKYPDVTSTYKEYQQVFDDFLSSNADQSELEVFKSRFESIFTINKGSIILDSSVLEYHYPYRFSSLPVSDSSFDVVLSFAVLEHVKSPHAVVSEIKRVLKPNGLSVQRIITQDHRSFSKLQGYHPLSYLNHSGHEWEEINKDKFYQNRLLPEEWRSLFSQYNFEIACYNTLKSYTLSDDDYSHLHPSSMDTIQTRHQAVNCDLIAVNNK